MFNFIKCPFCSGHEAVSPVAAEHIGQLIASSLFGMAPHDPRKAELENIRNTILSYQEREQQEDIPQEYICPTPAKAKYASREHASPNAAKYKQHSYLCECGYWHLSKQTGAQHHSKINSPAASADEFDAGIDPLML